MVRDTERATAAAALAGRERLTELARGGAAGERNMAQIADAAIFEEALLGALRARFAELREVAK
jgi:hypothetical protein